MYIDAGALVLVLIYGFLGYRYGLTGALINLAGMIGGYVAALFYARPAAAELAARANLAPLLALPIASILIFLLVTRSFYLLHLLVRKVLEGDKTGPSPLLTADRIGGMVFGLAKGAVIVGVLLWALPNAIGNSALAKDAGFDESQMAGLVRGGVDAAARYGASWMVDDPNVQGIVGRAASEPRRIVQEVAGLAANPNLQACFREPGMAEAVKTDGLVAVVRSPGFANAMSDPEFQKGLRGIGFAPPDGRPVSQQEVEQAVKTVSAKLSKSVDAMKNSATASEMQAFLADPEVQQKLKKGQVGEVLNDPRLTHALGINAAPAAPAAPARADG